MVWCLMPQFADKFKKDIVEGKITPDKLVKMTSKERHTFFSQNYGGEDNAVQINSLFESKLLLKNTQQGIVSWANSLVNVKPEVKRDIVSRAQKMTFLDVQNQDQLLEDLATKKLGMGVTLEEAQKITKLSQDIMSKKDNIKDDKTRVEYGNAILDMEDYLGELSGKDPSYKTMILSIANTPRSLMSSFDLSAPLRQGWGSITTKEFYPAFVDMFKYATNENNFRDLIADIITRPTYQLMRSGNLRIVKLSDKLSQREEDFMSTLVDRIPGIRASERAYVGFLNRLRADSFDNLIRVAQENGEDVSPGSTTVKDIASVVNNFTGSGNLGSNDRFAGAVPFLNSIFFSPRKMAATINMLNPVEYVRLSPTARKAALRRILGSVSATSMAIFLSSLLGAKFDTDPRSSDFGKVILGDTRLDVTGGNATYAVLLSRLISGQTKSSITGLTKELSTKYGSTSKADVMLGFMRNKLSPISSFFADWLYGEDAIGTPFNAKDEVINRVIPMSISSGIKSFTDDRDNFFISTALGLFGVGTNTYNGNVDWSTSTSKEMQQFKSSVSDEEFKRANEEYNTKLESAWEKFLSDPRTNNISMEDMAAARTKMTNAVKKEVFEKYDFKYKRESSEDKKTDYKDVVNDILK